MRAVDGVDWYWPAGEDPASGEHRAGDDRVWLLAPFDPVVWDRRRFEHFWGWPYRFEAYTPAPKRKLGHYALPLLWRERVVGWANVSVEGGVMRPEVGFVGPRIGDPAFVRRSTTSCTGCTAFSGWHEDPASRCGRWRLWPGCCPPWLRCWRLRSRCRQTWCRRATRSSMAACRSAAPHATACPTTCSARWCCLQRCCRRWPGCCRRVRCRSPRRPRPGAAPPRWPCSV